MIKLTSFILITLFLLTPILAVDYPNLNDYVTDEANIISEDYERQIGQLANQIEQDTTVEIAVVTIQSLEGLTKEQYAVELFEKEGIGKKDKDNGLLILVAIEEREYRVEVGYGLEGTIPDSSKVVLGTRILEPNFKENNFGKGIYDMLIAVEASLQGDDIKISKYQNEPQNRNFSTKSKIYLILFAIMILGSLLGGGRVGFLPFFFMGGRWNNGSGGFGSSGFGGFSGGGSGGGGFGGSF